MRIRATSIVVLAACAGLLAWHHVPRSSSVNCDSANAVVMARLSERCRLTFNSIPLAEALEQLAEAHELSIEIDPDAAVDFEDWRLSPVTLPPWEVSVDSALNLLLRQASGDLAPVVHRGRVVVTTDNARVSSTKFYVGQLHPIPAGILGVRGVTVEQLEATITGSFCQDEWQDVGGEGAIRMLPGAVALSHESTVQRKVSRLIDALAAIEREAARLEPIRINDTGPSAFARLRERLAGRVSLTVDDRSIESVLKNLSTRFDLPIVIDRKAIGHGGFVYRSGLLKKRISFDLQNVRLSTILEWTLWQAELVAQDRFEVIFVTEPGWSDQHAETVVYPVGDLLFGTVTTNTLVDTVTQLIDSDTWDVVGGDGAVIDCGSALVVTQTRRIQRAVADLLRRLRHVVSSPSLEPDIENWRLSGPVIEAMNRRVTIDVADQPLGTVVKQLLAQQNLNLLVDQESLALHSYPDLWEPLANRRANRRATSEPTVDAFGRTERNFPVSLKATDQPLRVVLKRLLAPDYLTASVWKDAVVVEATDRGCMRKSLRVYNVESLTPPARRRRNASDIVGLIESILGPDSWASTGGDGDLMRLHNALIVVQTREVHAGIRQLLGDLMRIPDEPDIYRVSSNSS